MYLFYILNLCNNNATSLDINILVISIFINIFTFIILIFIGI